MGIELWRTEQRKTNSDLICRICTGIFLSPNLCRSCRKTICCDCAKSTSHKCRDPILLKAPNCILRKLKGLLLYCKYRPKGCIYKDIMEEVLKHEEWCYYQPAIPIEYEIQQETTVEVLLQMVQDKSARNRNSHSHLQQEIQTLKKLQNQIIETEIKQQKITSALTAQLLNQNRFKEEILIKLSTTHNSVKTPSQAKLHIFNQNRYNRLTHFIQDSWQNFVDFERCVFNDLKVAVVDYHLDSNKPTAPVRRCASVDMTKKTKLRCSLSPRKPGRNGRKLVTKSIII